MSRIQIDQSAAGQKAIGVASELSERFRSNGGSAVDQIGTDDVLSAFYNAGTFVNYGMLEEQSKAGPWCYHLFGLNKKNGLATLKALVQIDHKGVPALFVIGSDESSILVRRKILASLVFIAA